MAARDPDVSADLVRRIREGDRDAWDALYLRYRDPLLFSIRCRLGPALRSRLQSEDILHSVVKDAMRDLEGFEPRGPKALDHWLHVCVLNKIRAKAEYFAAKKRAGEVPLSASIASALQGASDGEPGYIDRERYDRLESCLRRLPESMREVVLLRRIEGLSNAEAAEVLGKTPAATFKLHARAMARLGLMMREAEAP